MFRSRIRCCCRRSTGILVHRNLNTSMAPCYPQSGHGPAWRRCRMQGRARRAISLTVPVPSCRYRLPSWTTGPSSTTGSSRTRLWKSFGSTLGAFHSWLSFRSHDCNESISEVIGSGRPLQSPHTHARFRVNRDPQGRHLRPAPGPIACPDRPCRTGYRLLRISPFCKMR